MKLLRLAAGDLVFNPHLLLGNQISSAASSLSSYFDGIDSSLDKGLSVGDAVTPDQVRSAMQRLIHTSRLSGFQHAAKYTKKPMPALYGRKIAKSAQKRASNVDRFMVGSTKNWLNNTPDSEYVLSSERGLRAARYEANRAYYRGFMDAMSGSGFRKAWNTTSEEPCGECEDNSEQGYIDVDDQFQSGDPYPLAHLNCVLGDCEVAVKSGEMKFAG